MKPPSSSPLRESDPKLGVTSANSTLLSKHPFNKSDSAYVTPMPSEDMPRAQSVAVNTSSSELSGKQKEMRPGKPELSMDDLADLFDNKYTISKLITTKYSNLSFKDPRQYELTSFAIPREQYPGIALQDGGVKFVLRESPLTPVLQQRKMEGKDLNVLPQNILSCSKPVSVIAKGHEGAPSESTITVPCVIAPAAATDIRKAIDAVMKKLSSRAILRPTRRRVHPNLSNILAARKNPLQTECDSASEIEAYRVMVDGELEMLSVSKTNEWSQRVRLGKVNSLSYSLFVRVTWLTACALFYVPYSARPRMPACLPVPSGK